jgi:hypothetical protein
VAGVFRLTRVVLSFFQSAIRDPRSQIVLAPLLTKEGGRRPGWFSLSSMPGISTRIERAARIVKVSFDFQPLLNRK